MAESISKLKFTESFFYYSYLRQGIQEWTKKNMWKTYNKTDTYQIWCISVGRACMWYK